MSQAGDIFVIGGGIKECGVARDVAGRGYSVHLDDMHGLASGACSYSSKLYGNHSGNVRLVQGSQIVARNIHHNVVCRRSKLGIRFNKKQTSAIDDWMQQKIASDQCSEKLRSQNC